MPPKNMNKISFTVIGNDRLNLPQVHLKVKRSLL